MGASVATARTLSSSASSSLSALSAVSPSSFFLVASSSGATSWGATPSSWAAVRAASTSSDGRLLVYSKKIILSAEQNIS